MVMQQRINSPRPLWERDGGEGAACQSRRPSPLPQGARESACGLSAGFKASASAVALLALALWLPPLAAAQLNAELDKKQSPMGEPLRLRITNTASLNELDLAPLKND